LEFKHLNDARKTVRTFFVSVSVIGQPHFGHFIEDLLASPWPEYATATRWGSLGSGFNLMSDGIV
jgi:hypothetical protein